MGNACCTGPGPSSIPSAALGTTRIVREAAWWGSIVQAAGEGRRVNDLTGRVPDRRPRLVAREASSPFAVATPMSPTPSRSLTASPSASGGGAGEDIVVRAFAFGMSRRPTSGRASFVPWPLTSLFVFLVARKARCGQRPQGIDISFQMCSEVVYLCFREIQRRAATC